MYKIKLQRNSRLAAFFTKKFGKRQFERLISHRLSMTQETDKVAYGRIGWPEQAAAFLKIREELFGENTLEWGQAAEIYERVQSLGLNYTYTHFMKILPMAETYVRWQANDPRAPKTPIGRLGKRVSISAMLTLTKYFKQLSVEERNIIAKKIDDGRFNIADVRWIESTHQHTKSRKRATDRQEYSSKTTRFIAPSEHDQRIAAQDDKTIEQNFLALNQIATTLDLAVIDAVSLNEPMLLEECGIEITGLCRLADKYALARVGRSNPDLTQHYCAIAHSLAPTGLISNRLHEVEKIGSIASWLWIFYCGPKSQVLPNNSHWISTCEITSDYVKNQDQADKLHCAVLGNFTNGPDRVNELLLQRYYKMLQANVV